MSPVASVGSTALDVRLSRRHKLAGLLRDLHVPLTDVHEVDVVADGLSAARGLRAPGLALPGVAKYGTWRHRDGSRDYVAVRRGVPALRLRLSGHRYRAVLVSLDDAHDVAARLRPRP